MRIKAWALVALLFAVVTVVFAGGTATVDPTSRVGRVTKDYNWLIYSKLPAPYKWETATIRLVPHSTLKAYRVWEADGSGTTSTNKLLWATNGGSTTATQESYARFRLPPYGVYFETDDTSAYSALYFYVEPVK